MIATNPYSKATGVEVNSVCLLLYNKGEHQEPPAQGAPTGQEIGTVVQA